MTKSMPIGQLAKETGVKIPTIRYYEGVGLLPPPVRIQSHRRVYDTSDVKRLRFIRHARELGFEVDDIRQLLMLSDQPTHLCCAVDAIARSHLADIQSRIRRLNALKAEVSRMIKQCAKGRIADCRVIEVLANHEHCTHHDQTVLTGAVRSTRPAR
jgi:DNA-binding transcriptional MerR regulator